MRNGTEFAVERIGTGFHRPDRFASLGHELRRSLSYQFIPGLNRLLGMDPTSRHFELGNATGLDVTGVTAAWLW